MAKTEEGCVLGLELRCVRADVGHIDADKTACKPHACDVVILNIADVCVGNVVLYGDADDQCFMFQCRWCAAESAGVRGTGK